MVNNNDFLNWDVKPVWVVVVKSEITGAVSEYEFDILGLNRSSTDISRNWEKIHSVEQFNQGRVAKPSDFTITIAVKENGPAYEAMRRIAKGAIQFDIRCDIVDDVDVNDAEKHVWMKGFEKFIGCVVSRESQTIEIAEFPVREFECDALRHEILGAVKSDGTGTLTVLTEGDGTYPSTEAYAHILEFFAKKTPPTP